MYPIGPTAAGGNCSNSSLPAENESMNKPRFYKIVNWKIRGDSRKKFDLYVLRGGGGGGGGVGSTLIFEI